MAGVTRSGPGQKPGQDGAGFAPGDTMLTMLLAGHADAAMPASRIGEVLNRLGLLGDGPGAQAGAQSGARHGQGSGNSYALHWSISFDGITMYVATGAQFPVRADAMRGGNALRQPAAAPQHPAAWLRHLAAGVTPTAGVIAISIAVDELPRNCAVIDAVRRQCCVAAMVASALDVPMVHWVPAQLWTRTDELAAAVAAMADEGLPPVLHLVNFTCTDAATQVGGRDCHELATRGLDVFAGVELSLAYPAAMAEGEAVRRLARMTIHAMVRGAAPEAGMIAGLVDGEQLLIAVPTDSAPPVVRIILSYA